MPQFLKIQKINVRALFQTTLSDCKAFVCTISHTTQFSTLRIPPLCLHHHHTPPLTIWHYPHWNFVCLLPDVKIRIFVFLLRKSPVLLIAANLLLRFPRKMEDHLSRICKGNDFDRALCNSPKNDKGRGYLSRRQQETKAEAKRAVMGGDRKGMLLLSLNCVQLFVTPRTVGGQASLPIGFPRQEYWTGLPFFSQGIFPTQGLNPGLLRCRQILYHLSYQRNQTGKGATEKEEQEGMSKKPMKTPWRSKSSWTLSGRWSQNGIILLMFQSLILFRFRGRFWIKAFFFFFFCN